MRRREFITLIGAAATAWPLAAGAQQSGKLPIIGVLGVTGLIFGPWVAAFAERLSKLGWIEGRTVIIEYRWSEGRSERVAEIAAELARRGVDVILAYGGAVAVLRQATASIPHCLCTCERCHWRRSRRESFASGRQRDWFVGAAGRNCRQEI